MAKTRYPIRWPKEERRTFAVEIEIGKVHGLDPADILILKAMTHGLNCPEISEITGFEYETVKARIPAMQRMFGAKNSSQLVAIILREGIIS